MYADNNHSRKIFGNHGVALFCSLISIFFGVYYLIKAVHMKNSTSDYHKIQHYFLTGVVYIAFLPVILLTLSHSFLAPLFAISKEPIPTTESILLTSTEVIHETNPIIIYIYMLASVVFIYWLLNYIKVHKKKPKSI